MLCSTLPNPDVLPHNRILIESMRSPGSVPEAIKALSNTTFVTEVTSPTLAVLIPLLHRALNDRSMDVQRRTVIIVENVCKLVRDPIIAAQYLTPLLEGVTKIKETASFPEVRAFATSAYKTLVDAGATSEFQFKERDMPAEGAAAELLLLPLLPNELVTVSLNGPSSPPTPSHPLFAIVLGFASRLVADLVYRNAFEAADEPKWIRSFGVLIAGWTDGGKATAQILGEQARKHLLAIELVGELNPAFAL